MHRWWTYLQERFPPLGNGLLVAVFGLSALYHSALLRGQADLPGVRPAFAAFGLTLLFFFLLQVADEFKASLRTSRKIVSTARSGRFPEDW